MSSVQEDILAANAAFYSAFAARNVEAMERLWSDQAPIACIHPGWHPLNGRDAVMASWRGILRGPGSPDIACSDATAHVCGDAAFVLCTEQLSGGTLVATNMFIREDGGWKLVHHHAGTVADTDDDDERPPSSHLH